LKTITAIAILLIPLNSYGLTIEKAVELALKNNPDIKSLNSKLRTSKLTVKEKKRNRFGKFILNGGYTHYNIPRTLSPIVPPITPSVVTDKDISNLGVSYTVTLFSGFSQREEVKIARIDNKLTGQYTSLTKAQIAYNVRSIFLKILSMKENREAVLSYMKALKTLKKDIDTGIQVGKRPEIDQLKVEAEIEKTKSELQTINGNLKILKSTLAFLLGKEKLDENIEKIEPQNNNPISPESNNNPRIEIAKLNLKKSEKTVKKIKSTYLPSIKLSGYYGNNFGGGERETLWQVGVSFNWLLFDFGSRKLKVEKAEEGLIISRLNIEKTKLSVAKDLKEALTNIETAKETIKSAEKEKQLTEKVKKIEKVRYSTGTGTIYDLLTAEAKAVTAQTKLITAKYSLLDSIYYLKYVKGEVK